MQFNLKIECDNDAFNPPAPELSRLLDVVSRQLIDGLPAGASVIGSIKDINGNAVGMWSFVDEDAEE